MGVVRQTVRFGAEDGNRWITTEAVVDIGSVHCQITAQLGARLFRRSRVLLANGDIEERDVVYVQLSLDPSLPEVLTTAVVGTNGAPFLVGAVALEQLGLGVDPSTGQIVPDVPLLLRIANWRTL